MNINDQPEHPRNYLITINGHLDISWTGWFEGMTIECQDDGTTLLTGYLPDQPALYGLISKLQKMGLSLLSIDMIKPE
jgi:hypothetical protein